MLNLLVGRAMITSETKSYICFFFKMRDVSANVVRTLFNALCNNDTKQQD